MLLVLSHLESGRTKHQTISIGFDSIDIGQKMEAPAASLRNVGLHTPQLHLYQPFLRALATTASAVLLDS